jgi:hypothetical protein
MPRRLRQPTAWVCLALLLVLHPPHRPAGLLGGAVPLVAAMVSFAGVPHALRRTQA